MIKTTYVVRTLATTGEGVICKRNGSRSERSLKTYNEGIIEEAGKLEIRKVIVRNGRKIY